MSNPSQDRSEKAASSRSVRAKRLFVYVAGFFIMAVSVSVAVRSNLGVSPVTSMPYMVSRISGIEMGNCTILVFSAYVLIEILILRRDFHWIQLLQVACAVLFGKFVTLTNLLFAGLTPSGYGQQILLTCISVFLIAFGVRLYLTADLIPQAAEGLVQAVCKKTGMKLSTGKNLFDLCSIGLAALLSLVFLGRIDGLREGTVIAALGVGRVMALLEKLDGGRLRRFVYSGS